MTNSISDRPEGNGTIGFIQRELERISLALNQDNIGTERQGRLYAVQQALSWAVDPDMFRSPYAWATGTQGETAGCLADPRPPSS